MGVTIDAQFPNPELPDPKAHWYSRIVMHRWKFDDLETALTLMKTIIDAEPECLGMQLTWTREEARDV